MTPLTLALFAFVLGVAVATALARDPLVTVLVFAAYSLGLAVLWVVYRAPDVGLTEAAVGAGVTSSLLFATLAATGRLPLRPGEDRPSGSGSTSASTSTSTTATPTFTRSLDPRGLVVAGGFVAALLVTVPSLPAVGDPSAPAFGGPAAYYLQNTADLGITNVVTAVLVVFRGFDTFGEIAVVFAAAVAVLVVLGRETP